MLFKIYFSVPPISANLTVVSFTNFSNGSTVKLQWNSLLPGDQQYQIRIATPEGRTYLSVSYSSVRVSIDYNLPIEITLAICDDILATKNITLLKCQDPSSVPGVTTAHRQTVTTEGSVITYQCLAGHSPSGSIRTMCRGNQWHPMIMCTGRCTKSVLFQRSKLL